MPDQNDHVIIAYAGKGLKLLSCGMPNLHLSNTNNKNLPGITKKFPKIKLVFNVLSAVFYQSSYFYQTASVSEIRRAYRKLSLVLHPDKNKSPDAEVKFRQVR